ncbi:MAG: hypothetical protein KDA45_12180, partial [Planctomycetales bacterium]|nr:hypothetical protein [Planctomycetales bacterium]
MAPWSDGFYYPPIGVSTAFLPNGLSYQEYAAISSQQYGTNGGGGSGFLHGEGAGNFANLTEVEPNDVLTQATPINLGTGAGQNDGVAIVGNLALPSVPGAGPDQDYYVFDLKAGDIFDAHVLGLAAQTFDLAILDSQRREIIGNRGSASGNYPIPDSPLTQTTGNADLAFVVPADGRYYARLSDGDSVYTLTLRVRRPVLESQPVGTKQKIFLDFDGEYLRNEIFGGPGGTARLSPLVDTLPNWGLTAADESRIIDRVVDVFRSKFFGATAVSGVGGNGHYGTSGIAGQFDIEILNSRDHADPWGQPNVSRIIIGGTALELGINTVGIAQSIDIGNFDTTETAVVLADTILANFGGVPRAGNLSLEDVMVDSTALVAVHEAGHFLGGWHTLNSNNNPQIMDTGGTPANLLGVGLDGIYGTADDRDVQFGTDTYDPTASGIQFGRQNSAAAMAWGLSTGKVGGGTIRGNVYVDRNLSRTRDASDAPLAGAVIYVDMNNDGIHQVGELTSVADAAGNYQLSVPPGTYVIREIAPAGYRVALPQGNGYQLTVAANQTIANRDFANDLLDMTVTGRKFNDINGNGIIDAGEPGIENVWIYVDLDGDQRIDIGEPAAKTKADGTYKLTFPPQAGVYKLREVIESGYTQTVPGAALNHEYTVTLTGNPAVDNLAIAGLHFGNQLAAADYGDAPATYGAAFHSFREGLFLGAQWDAEAANQPSADAKGDDNNGVDDEDGIGISQPLVEGGENSISVTAVNTTGQVAYLQGWIDLNNDGDFADAGERLITNAVVGTQPVTAVTFTLPAGVAGDRFARFRYSLSRDTGPTGPATSGEVEDYVLTILPASQGNLAVDDVAGPFTQGSVLNEIDVLANDFKSPGETLELVSISEPTSGGRVVISSSNTLLYTPPSR